MTPDELIRIESYLLDRKKPDYELSKMIMEALEKQIPKKPRKDEYGFYMCPSCGADEHALMHDSNIANCYKNCHNCGQALDWSDTE